MAVAGLYEYVFVGFVYFLDELIILKLVLTTRQLM